MAAAPPRRISVSMPPVHIADLGSDETNYAAQFMHLVEAEKGKDGGNFEEVVEYLKLHCKDIVKYVHDMHHLMVDDGKVMLNCPPAPEAGNNHGDELIRTISEIVEDEHIVVSREFKVHHIDGDKTEVRVATKFNIGKPDYKYAEKKAVF